MNEFEREIRHVSDAVTSDKSDRRSTISIRGAALSDPSLLFINYVGSKLSRKLWRRTPQMPNLEKRNPDLDPCFDDDLEAIDERPIKETTA